MKVERPCLQYHMHYCEAPCFNKISVSDYGKYIDEIVELFEGKPIPLLKEIKEKMELAAEDLRFEDAARYRDQLSSIEKIQEKQRMVTQRGDLDVLGLAVDTSMACVQLLFISWWSITRS